MKKNHFPKPTGINLIALGSILFSLICGILLLFFPGTALLIVNYLLAAISCVYGAVCVVQYLRENVPDSLKHQKLSKGLIFLCIGLLICIRPRFLEEMLLILLGLYLLAGGFQKIQTALDLKKLKTDRWWIVLIGALLSLLLGAFTVGKPQFLSEILVQFIGAALLIEAIQDFSLYLISNQKIKNYQKAVQSASIDILDSQESEQDESPKED